jgi:hypothetical protein
MYIIPRNYTDNGRVLGLFESRHTVQAMIFGVPVAMLIWFLPLIPLMVKGVLLGFFVIFPCMVILTGMGDRVLYIMRHRKNARHYYLSKKR